MTICLNQILLKVFKRVQAVAKKKKYLCKNSLSNPTNKKEKNLKAGNQKRANSTYHLVLAFLQTRICPVMLKKGKYNNGIKHKFNLKKLRKII